ncbi:MAG: LCP family protein [Anaerolineae bacterium]|nr:LCP family protein [Thermoflexales bacterium]MDW8407014.1 LCP family protein [Anaerolineae bacterium]
MSKQITAFFELVLLFVVVAALGLGVSWIDTSSTAPAAAKGPAIPPPAEQAVEPTPTESVMGAVTTQIPSEEPSASPTPLTSSETLTQLVLPTVVATPIAFDPQIELDERDAPLLVQAPGTVNVLLLGSDAAADNRYARTDTIIIASINPDLPSVSLLSLPRDLQVRIPGHGDDRINIAYELGYMKDYPGGGPAFLAAVLRKNFGIRIDHFVRVDFAGFIKAVDTLGGVDVIVECELHDTFPDKASPSGKSDLDVYPGVVTLNGKQALWYARSRWSTTDFDRARRQQKVLRALFNKARQNNLLQSAFGLYNDFRENVETSIGIGDLPFFIDIAARLDDLAIKNRVVTYPVIKAFTRADGAQVLLPTQDTIPYIAESLSPPAGNRAQSRPLVEVVNLSGRPDMEKVAQDRLIWEGFAVYRTEPVSQTVQANTQIVNFATTAKGSPIARLANIFRVTRQHIQADPDPSSAVVARIVLGENYNSCPSTSTMAGDVPLAPDTNLIPTSTPSP